MNKHNAKDFLPLVQAMAEGKTIQYLAFGDTWKDTDVMPSTTPPSCYRIKPEPIQRWGVVSPRGKLVLMYVHEKSAAKHVSNYGGRYFLMREVV